MSEINTKVTTIVPLEKFCNHREDPWVAVASYLNAIGFDGTFTIKGQMVHLLEYNDQEGFNPSDWSQDQEDWELECYLFDKEVA